jgi:signal transduction histidine kinase
MSQMNRELDQFAYVASHDLKAPLRGIASLSSWIEDDLRPQLSDQTRQLLALLRSRILRMEALIDGLLQYSRAGRVRNRIHDVPIAGLLTEVIEMLAPSATVSIDVGPMPTLRTERVPLEQVFLNLLSNALKHANRPDVHVTVRAQNRDDFYEFIIADNGQGIPRKYHSRIWDIFQTLHPRDMVEGAGIGLALVKKNVEARGGNAWVESDEGLGAAFHFLWPKLTREEGKDNDG